VISAVSRRNLLGLFAAFTATVTKAQEPIEVFDAHLHYNWEPTPYLTMDEALALFRQHRVTGILATSRPNNGTHALVSKNPSDLWVVPFIRPYLVRPDVQSWFTNPVIFELVQEEFKRGYYVGIGEFHLTGTAAASEVVRKTVNFAVEHDLFLHAHADEEAVEILFQHNQRAKVIWAHTGFSLETNRVEALLRKHAMLWGELSYRSGITGSEGALTPEWRRLFVSYPGRFLLGSDTWINERWGSYGAIMAGYRAWLGQLPTEVARLIAHGNARSLFLERMKRRG
jgi:Amidohydrolase